MMLCYRFFFFKQKTAYEMRISDWSSDVCSSDLFPKKEPLRAELEAFRDAVRGLSSELATMKEAVHTLDVVETALLSAHADGSIRDRKSVVSGKSVLVRVDLGGRRIIHKK